MTAIRTYERPPITEAVIDLRITAPNSLDLALLSDVRKAGRSDYPEQEPLLEATGSIEWGPGKQSAASARQEHAGFRFLNSDRTLIGQARKDGFTLSRLSPYEGWAPFRDEARRLWGSYREKVQPFSIQRLAVRYINRIDIPVAESVDLDAFFLTIPTIAPGLPQTMEGYFLNVQLADTALLSHVVINQTIVPPSRAGVVSVILDVDIFRMADIPQEEQALWDFFEVLHERKNAVFEACITDKARELFEPCLS